MGLKTIKKQTSNQKLKSNEKFRRQHQISSQLNDYEMNAFIIYCNKYKVKNKSKFIREALMSVILDKFDEDYPRLFEDQENEE